MSGALSVLNGVASTVGTLKTLANILTGTKPVQLGTVSFDNNSLPESIRDGSDYSHKLHKMPGGGRRVAAMGQDAKDVTWSGYFIGSDAGQRYDALSALADLQENQTLTSGNTNLEVFISSVERSTHVIGSLIGYSITCVVISIPQSAFGVGNILSDITADVSNLVGVDVGALGAQVASAVSAVAPALQTFGALGAGSLASVGMTASLIKLQNAASSVQAISNGNLAGVINAGPFTDNTSYVSAINIARASTSSLVQLNSIASYSGRALNNLGNT